MTITITNVGGVGINSSYVVRKDGKAVATISRSGNSWALYSHPYYKMLYRRHSRLDVVAAAEEFPFLAPPELYEQICQEVEAERRMKKERANSQEITRLSRAILAGSNSAHEELAALFAEIDRFAADRSDLGSRDLNDVHIEGYQHHNFGTFPRPPQYLKKTA